VINGHWKIPISYYLIAGMKAKERAEVMKKALFALYETVYFTLHLGASFKLTKSSKKIFF
jgi:hypothetical protein